MLQSGCRFIYFNSIKVRLELIADHSFEGKTVFQFHKGAIRTDLLGTAVAVLGRFQFHKGAIRTSVTQFGNTQSTNFNSIKVRLEHIYYNTPLFRSYDFNSIKVRLEQCSLYT